MNNYPLRFLVLILFALISNVIVAQELPRNPQTGIIEFTGLVNVEASLSQNVLYTKTKEWFANSFKSANSVIQMDDKEGGIIIGKGTFTDRKAAGVIYFTLKVQVKDGRYKYWFSNFIHEEHLHNWSGGNLENEKPACGYFLMAKRVWKEFIPEVIYLNVESMIQSLKEGLSIGSVEKDKW